MVWFCFRFNQQSSANLLLTYCIIVDLSSVSLVEGLGFSQQLWIPDVYCTSPSAVKVAAIFIVLSMGDRIHTTYIWKYDSIISPHYYYCYYQVHHHVHRADFVWIHFIKHLLHLFERGPRGDIMSPTLFNELLQRRHKHLLVHTAIHFGTFARWQTS